MSEPLDPTLRAWRWRVFAATWLSYFGFYFCRKPFYIAKADLGEQNGWDASMLGGIGTAYLVAYALGQFLAGFLGDRIGPRALLLIGMGVSLGANAVFGLTNSYETFLVFMVVNGLAQATGWSANVGTMANWFRRSERGSVMGVWATNFQVGGVAANGLAAYVLGSWGVQWSFFAGSVVLFLVWGFFLLNQRNAPSDVGLHMAREDVPAGEQTASMPGKAEWTGAVITNVLIIGVFYFFVKLIRYALWSWAPYLLKVSYGLEGDEAGFLSTTFDLAGIAGVIAIGVLSDRVFGGRRALVSFLFVLGMAASCAVLYLFGPKDLAVFTVCMGLIGFTLYGPDALMTSAGAMDAGPPQRAVLAAGIINGMGSLGGVTQELVLGRMLDKDDVGPVFAVLLASGLCAAMALGVMVARNRLGRSDL